MKKFLISILVVSVFLCFEFPFVKNLNAKENIITNTLNFDENNPAESYLEILPDNVQLEYGDSLITRDALQTGIDIQNKKNGMRTGGELWTLTGSVVYQPYSVLDGKYKEKLGSGEGNGNDITFTFSLSYLSKYNIQLEGTFTWTFSYERSGPSGTERVGTNYATHKYFVGVASGEVIKYTYRITDKYTGVFIRNQTVYGIAEKKQSTYGILAYYNASTDIATIRSVSNSKTKSLDEDDLISYWNSENVYSYVDF